MRRGSSGISYLDLLLAQSRYRHDHSGLYVVLLSLRGRVVPAVVLSIIAALCLTYFFTPPIFSFQIDTPEDIVTVVVFATASLLIAGLVKRARRLGEAAALKDRLQVIIDTIPAAVWSNSPDGSADFLNKPFRDYIGLSLQEARGLAWPCMMS